MKHCMLVLQQQQHTIENSANIFDNCRKHPVCTLPYQPPYQVPKHLMKNVAQKTPQHSFKTRPIYKQDYSILLRSF